jgi:uncharacterized membrane protein YfcA
MITLVGFLIAAAVGLTGVGAGSITAPILILFCAQDPASAVGTTLVFATAIKLLVTPIYLRRRQVSASALMLSCLGGIPGVVIGTALLNVLHAHGDRPEILGAVGLTIVGMAALNLIRTVRHPRAVAGRDRRRWLPWMAGLIGIETGFSSAGTGALGSVLLMNFTSLSPSQIVGTDLCFGLAVSAVGAGWHFSAGSYNPALLWKLLAGGVPGVVGGALLSSNLPARPLRIALSTLLCALGVQLCIRALW